MSHLKAFCSLLLLVMVSFHAHALSLTYNGTDQNIAPSRFKDEGFSTEAGWGTSLGELVPLAFEVEEISVTDTQQRRHTLPAYPIGHNLFQVHIHYAEGRYDIVYPGGIIRDIQSVAVRTHPLDPRPLEVWISWEGTDVLRSELQRFSEIYSIPLTIKDVPSIPQKLLSYGRSRERMPDVVMLQSDHLPQYLQERLLQPSPVTPPAGIQQSALDAFTLNDTLWAVPFYVDSHVIIYNPELMDIPDHGRITLEELEQQLMEFADLQGITPASWNIYSAYWLIPFIHGFGKDSLLSDDHQIIVTDDPTIDALTYLMDLVDRGLLDPLERDGMMAGFLQGSVGMMLTGSFAIPNLERLGVPFAAAPYPLMEAAGRPVAPLLDYKGFAVTRRSHNPAAAARLIEYLASPRVQQKIPASIGKLPADKQTIDYAQEHHPYADVLRLSLERGMVIPPYPAYSIFKDVLWSMLRLMVSGRIPLEDGLHRAQGLIDSRLEDIQRYQR